MSFEDNKVFWEGFILLYQENPCLWDVKSKDYRNKQKKNAAYGVLIQKCQELFPQANKDFVVKKIASLRSSFRLQIRRINGTKRSGAGAGDVPESTLWYFDLLSFLLDQEELRPAVSSLLEENSLDSQSHVSETDSYTQESQDATAHSNLSPVLSPETPPTSSTSSSRKKRPHETTPWTKKRQQFLDASLRILEKEDVTQPSVIEPQEITFGKNVGQQLQDVQATRQKIIAQKLISDILFHAKLGNLTDSSQISLGYQPAPYSFVPSVPQAAVYRQTANNYPTATRSTFNEPTASYTSQSEVSTPQTFGNELTPLTPASTHGEMMREFICFKK